MLHYARVRRGMRRYVRPQLAVVQTSRTHLDGCIHRKTLASARAYLAGIDVCAAFTPVICTSNNDDLVRPAEAVHTHTHTRTHIHTHTYKHTQAQEKSDACQPVVRASTYVTVSGSVSTRRWWTGTFRALVFVCAELLGGDLWRGGAGVQHTSNILSRGGVSKEHLNLVKFAHSVSMPPARCRPYLYAVSMPTVAAQPYINAFRYMSRSTHRECESNSKYVCMSPLPAAYC
jgi:hypothetical protein